MLVYLSFSELTRIVELSDDSCAILTGLFIDSWVTFYYFYYSTDFIDKGFSGSFFLTALKTIAQSKRKIISPIEAKTDMTITVFKYLGFASAS